jgi:putative ATPase
MKLFEEGADSPDLFSGAAPKPLAPLAHRLRPRTLDEWIGHDRVLGERGIIHLFLKSKNVPSILLWGPPGVGKTSLAILIAEKMGEAFLQLSAVTAGVKEIKEAAEKARQYQHMGRRSVLFLDEIHRLNKSQQDSLLPYVESGLLTLIGATTENPSFEVNSALLSRMRVVRLDRLTDHDLHKIIVRALDHPEGYGQKIKIDTDAIQALVEQAEGDARRALTLLEATITIIGTESDLELETESSIHLDAMTKAIQSLGDRVLPYDKKSEEHHNVISAFIKSMRASDPDAAVYYLARMLESGEDPRFIARRMIVFASEDIGNADPRAILIAVSAQQALEVVGLPEARINLAHAAISLALSKKDRSVYDAIQAAMAEVQETGALPVPMVLRNPVTRLMKDEGYGKGDPEKRMPEGLRNKSFYHQKR